MLKVDIKCFLSLILDKIVTKLTSVALIKLKIPTIPDFVGSITQDKFQCIGLGLTWDNPQNIAPAQF